MSRIFNCQTTYWKKTPSGFNIEVFHGRREKSWHVGDQVLSPVSGGHLVPPRGVWPEREEAQRHDR